MITPLRHTLDLLIKLFALGLFMTMLLSWFDAYPLRKVQRLLNRFYDIFLNPIRRYVRPIRLGPSAPVGLDLAPLILLFLLWWLVHPFLMWVLS